jgi:glycerol-3-phosphate dehydrogenase (NAD(P)+)
MPSHAARSVYEAARPHVAPGTPIVSATKGLDSSTLLRMSQVIEQVFGAAFPVGVISGPSFAREVAEGKPTALVCGSRDPELVTAVQERFSGETLRVYGSSDPVGVELGGALKNVIAIAAGICDGLALGHNAVAALVTRGLAEISRLAVACGARAETLAGLAGMGDLVLTCTGDMSRNRQVGLKLASGARLDAIVASTPTVAEGVRTAALAMQLAEQHGVDMPITAEMQAIMKGERAPGEAISRLMTRALRSELPTDRNSA